MLSKLNIEYKVDPTIVRGLDYYTKTVFEFISKEDGLTVLAGGRYDGLVKELGGINTPAVGFAAGVERLLNLMPNELIKNETVELYIANMSQAEIEYVLKLKEKLREFISVESDISERSFNSQLKYANKIKAKNLLVIGEDEIKNGIGKIKNMSNGEEVKVNLNVQEIVSKIN